MGKPAADIALKLYFHDGATWSTVAATTTGVDGFYVFPPPPSLAPGQRYRVGFGPNQDPTGNPSYVYRWYGPDITSYVAGDAVPAGSNDIADVKLLWPPANYMATQLPEQFDWQQRNLGPESYQWVLFNPSSPSTVWRTDLLGDVGSYLLPGLPTGFNPGFRYGWYVNAHSAANGYVTSYYVRQITFVAAPASPVGSSSQPRGLEAPEDLLGSVPSTER
jgi:hypothetical protein